MVDLSPKPYQVDLPVDLVVAIDTSGSVADWRKDIFDRLGMLYTYGVEMCRPSPSSPRTLSIQFVGFGDAAVPSDTIEVAPPGEGGCLASYLAQIRKDCLGGGNDQESSDLVLLYVDRFRTSSNKTKSKILVIVTDEGPPKRVDPEQAKRWLGVTLEESLSFQDLKLSLQRKGWGIFCVQKPYEDDPSDRTKTNQFRSQWVEMLGEERVLFLDTARRVVDVLIGILAASVGRFDFFTEHLKTRHLVPGNQYGTQNVHTVLQALAPMSRVMDAKVLRKPQTHLLLPESASTVVDLLDPDMS